MTIQLKEVPATQGLQWVKTGLQLARVQPLGFASLLSLMLTLVLVLLMLPILGPLALLILMPIFWLIFMLASQQVGLGRRIHPWQLVQTLYKSFSAGTPAKDWLVLGLLYTSVTVMVMWVAGILGPDMQTMSQAIEQAQKSQPPQALRDPALLQGMLWRLGLSWPISLVFWHTPALLYWGETKPIKAVFFSAVACWRNLGAYVVFALGWTSVGLVVLFILEVLARLIGPGILMQMLSMIIGLWLAAAFYASLYTSVADCLIFEATPTPSPLTDPAL